VLTGNLKENPSPEDKQFNKYSKLPDYVPSYLEKVITRLLDPNPAKRCTCLFTLQIVEEGIRMQYGDTSVKTSYDTYFKDEDTEQEIILYDQQVSKLREWVPGFDDRHLLYRASRDGWYAKDFHSRCDN